MHMNTTYKVFVAHAAAKLMTEMVGYAIKNGDIDTTQSYNVNKDMYEHLAIHASRAAEALAEELEENWKATGDHETVFFDVEDTPLTELEKAVYEVSTQIEDFVEAVKAPSQCQEKLNCFQEIAKNLYDIEGHLRALTDLHVVIDENEE